MGGSARDGSRAGHMDRTVVPPLGFPYLRPGSRFWIPVLPSSTFAIA